MADPEVRVLDPVEAEVRRSCEAGDVRGAATIAIRELGPELLGFLIVSSRDPVVASDIFADVCVRIWRALAGFRWDCSLRTWAYVIARRAHQAHQRTQHRWAEHHVRLSEAPEIEPVVANVRTTTLARMSGEPKTRVQRLREQLTSDEQALLTLRIDRNLEWREIARVLADEDDLDEAALARAAAGLRKRFERLKERLRRLAAEDAPG